ncbi:hypothetical protein LguiB_030481 [Lonicera macranthoides]
MAIGNATCRYLAGQHAIFEFWWEREPKTTSCRDEGAANLREEKNATQVAKGEAKKYKANANKYEEGLSRSEDDLEALKNKVRELQAVLKKYQDLELQAKATRDHTLKNKQALVDGRSTESEKTYEKCHNDAIIAVTADMK